MNKHFKLVLAPCGLRQSSSAYSRPLAPLRKHLDPCRLFRSGLVAERPCSVVPGRELTTANGGVNPASTAAPLLGIPDLCISIWLVESPPDKFAQIQIRGVGPRML
jgi:hypothetical protein